MFFDDILIAAKTISEHDSILRQVLKRLFDKGITLNKEKCQFVLPEIDFLDYHLNATGIAPSSSKIDSIRTMTVPETKEQLRSFLAWRILLVNGLFHIFHLLQLRYSTCVQSQHF